MNGKNAVEIFKLLAKTNCRECGDKTCFAFASQVSRGKKKISECPYLPAEFRSVLVPDQDQASPDNEYELAVAEMRKQLVLLNFKETAERIGGSVENGALCLKILGKPFCIRPNGSFYTDLHLIPWLVMPLLHYVLHGKGGRVTEDWVSYRELPGGKEKYALFKKRSEDVLLQLADQYTDFFDDVIHMFHGKAVARQFAADVSIVLHPFPLVPIMICYWQANEGLQSSLNIFFDRSAGDNLGADAVFTLGSGLVQMFCKFAAHHGF
jgi:hypothetical protein